MPWRTGWRQAPALAVEDWLRAALAESRGADAAGSARLGAHRADMTLEDAATGLTAALASTGQQKALLIGVVLGHAALIAAARGAAPLLLLDEPAVHLDADRRAALWEALAQQPGAGGSDRDRPASRSPGSAGSAEFLRRRRRNFASGPPFRGARPCPFRARAPIFQQFPMTPKVSSRHVRGRPES